MQRKQFGMKKTEVLGRFSRNSPPMVRDIPFLEEPAPRMTIWDCVTIIMNNSYNILVLLNRSPEKESVLLIS